MTWGTIASDMCAGSSGTLEGHSSKDQLIFGSSSPLL